MSRTPVILLSGFLGAGKTTLLQRLIPAAARVGLKAAVLMNESGNVSIDGPLAQAGGVEVIDVLGGCVCCELKGELHGALVEMLDRFSPALIFVETTGIADPLEVVDACTASDLVSRLDPRGVVTLVDAAHGPSALDIADLAKRQVELANVVIVNKVDRVKPDALMPLWLELKALAPAAELVETTFAQVDADALLAKLLGQRAEMGSGTTSAEASHEHANESAENGARPHVHGHGLLALSYRIGQAPANKQSLLDLLRSLPDNVIRAKGFLRMAGDERVWICQLANGYAQASVFPLPNFNPEAVLVVIGKGLDRAAVERALGPMMPEEF